MKKIVTTAFLFLFFIMAGFSCTPNGGGGIFLPDLSRQWTNKADATNTFFFLVEKPTESSSAFTGNENPIGGGSQFHFSGSYNNNQIQFTYDSNSGTKSNKNFSGTINSTSTVITLNNSQLGSIILEKK